MPFSVEFELPGGLGTDLPSEPIMWILLLITPLILIRNINELDKKLLTHPISLLITGHLFWIAFTCLFSTNQVFSLKFFLAKTWYVIPFYFLPLLILDSEKNYRKLFFFLSIGLFISVSYVMLRHAGSGFSFESINKAVRPIFRNHVNYGVMLISFLPFLVYLTKTKFKSGLIKYGLLIYLLLAIYLTYTRAAQLSVVLAAVIYFVIQFRLAKYAIILSIVSLVGLGSYLSIGNNYLDFAPEYTKAIEHKKFDNLVEATYKMEDISTVERFYRWIAGFNMVKEKPILGFGPSTFYSNYKSYTITSYKTYVSDNPEKSGIHNYYLMTMVEQGIIGFIILMSLIFAVIFYGEVIYHRNNDKKIKALIMASIVCFTLICIVQLINDLLEADKIGPFFFMAAAIITSFHIKFDKKLS